MANKKARTSSKIPRERAPTTFTEAVPLSRTPTMGISATDQEHRGFEYFCWKTGQDIGHAWNLDLAHRLILQTSHSNPAVRSAVIAVGSIVEQVPILTLENEHNSCDEFAQGEYCKALKHLREQIVDDPIHSQDLAIITCFLFTLCDLLQGNDTASMVHLRSGLNMIRQHDGPPDSFRNELLRIFSVMEVQATLWMGIKTLKPSMLVSAAGHQ